MPLVIVSGLPLAGKTTRSNQLKSLFENYIANHQTNLRNVIVINDEYLSIDKKTAYDDANSEKIARGNLMSAVERLVSREDIVICDSLNYIKGFRYQLYCIARAMGTPCCSLLCGISKEEALNRNLQTNTYKHDQCDNLCTRFEEPDGRNRWDAPLFIVISEDASLEDISNKISTDIIDAAILKKPPAPNLSTVVKPLFETNYLTELDKTTSDILDTVIEAQKNGRSGNIKVPKSTAPVVLPSRNITLAELRRIKRQYLHINKMHAQADMNAVGLGFVEYLNTNIA
ncbi:chromatin associated protein KTI12 [Globomyces pollinis-pini]|nr:chromatin associated protein KTI12 [Globomyces pollinis-pini]